MTQAVPRIVSQVTGGAPPQSLTEEDQLLSVREVAGRLGSSTHKVRDLLRSGRLTPIRLDGRTLVSRKEVELFIAALPRQMAPPRWRSEREGVER
jgi:excisionase family DNA binding protein